MTTRPPAARHAAASRLTGGVLGGLAVAFLLFDATIKVLALAPVTEAFDRLGYPSGLAAGLGVVELLCTVAYLVPRTRAAGAVLLTGFLGGAVATHLRVHDPWLSHTLFPVYVGALLWAGWLLRR